MKGICKILGKLENKYQFGWVGEVFNTTGSKPIFQQYSHYTQALTFLKPLWRHKTRVQKEWLGSQSCPCAFWVLVLEWLCALHPHNAGFHSHLSYDSELILLRSHWDACNIFSIAFMPVILGNWVHQRVLWGLDTAKSPDSVWTRTCPYNISITSQSPHPQTKRAGHMSVALSGVESRNHLCCSLAAGLICGPNQHLAVPCFYSCHMGYINLTSCEQNFLLTWNL